MPLQLWPDPRDGLDPTDPLSGLDPNDAPWNWSEAANYYDGPTKDPPTPRPGWEHLAMTTTQSSKESILKRRIREFYDLLNQGQFPGCFQMIDPRIRHNPNSVTLFQYENSLREFLNVIGLVLIDNTSIEIHTDEPSEIYAGRDFALGKTTWDDERGQKHVFSERWVLEGGAWYTRSTGFLVPSRDKLSASPEIHDVRQTDS